MIKRTSAVPFKNRSWRRIGLNALMLAACYYCLPNASFAQKEKTKSKSTKGIDYSVDAATGVKYHFYKHDKTAPNPKMDDVVTLIIQWKDNKDSVIFNSIANKRRRPGDTIGTIMIMLKKSFNGCLEQGITLMADGDSASFLISADSLYTKTFHAQAVPPFIHSGTNLTFDVKLLKFQTQDEIMKMQQDEEKLKGEQRDKARQAEPVLVSKYLSDSNYKAIKPTADSIYILKNTPGKGKPVAIGDSVYCKYVGKFLNGSIFDQSSIHGNGLFSFVYNGSSSPVIKGWSIIIGGMSEGGKITVLIPSKLAYGAYGAGNMIGPYTPLIFDIELVKVVKKK